jgi:hypothetical protein
MRGLRQALQQAARPGGLRVAELVEDREGALQAGRGLRRAAGLVQGPAQVEEGPRLAEAVVVPPLDVQRLGQVVDRLVEAVQPAVGPAEIGQLYPDLAADPVAVPQLDLRAVGGAVAGDVQALAQCFERAVAVVVPVLVRVVAVAVPQLLGGAVAPTRSTAARS